MQRELTIERRGEFYHLRFHNYMGPWEGHQIERILDLEEVEPPPGGEHYEEVLGPNQAYLWHEMDFDPDLHALVTADRLERVAVLVRDRDVHVKEGSELLPEPPPTAHVDYELRDDTPDGSYVALIEKRHESAWDKGPKAVAGAFVLRAVPAIVVILAIVVIGRHTGDKREVVPIGEMFRRAAAPTAEQGFLASVFDPDHSHLVRHEIRSVSYASGSRMLLGDGNYLSFEGAGQVMPWLTVASTRSSPLVVDATIVDGGVHVDQVTCADETLGKDLRLRYLGRLPAGDGAPSRGTQGREGMFQPVAGLPRRADDAQALRNLEGQRISVEGRLVREGDRLLLRTGDGTGLEVRAPGVTRKMQAFLDVFTDDPGPITVDVVVTEVRPRDERVDASVVGEAEIYSASAQNYHVIGRR